MVDADGITAVEPRREERNKVIDGLTSLKGDEKRAAVGYDSTAGGDVILVDSNKKALEIYGKDAFQHEIKDPQHFQLASI